MIFDYDVVVIGTGTAGSTVAFDCASKKLKVLIVDIGPLAAPVH